MRMFALSGIVVGIVGVGALLTLAPQARPDKDAAPAKDLTVSGRVEASGQTQIYARIVGYVQKVDADIGDHVRKGQVLAEQSVPEVEAEVKQKEALVAHAEASFRHAEHVHKAAAAMVPVMDAQVQEAEVGVKTAKGKLDAAGPALERVKKLVAAGSADAKLVEEATRELEAAKAALEEAESRVGTAKAAQEGSVANRGSAQAAVKVATAQLDAAKADLEHSRAMLQYARIVAPFDGVVTTRAVDVGALAGPPGARGQVLFTVSRVDPVRVVVAMPEDLGAARIRTGSDAVVRVGPQGKLEIKGKVTRTAGALDPDKHTLRVEIELPNGDGKLLPGMQADVALKFAAD